MTRTLLNDRSGYVGWTTAHIIATPSGEPCISGRHNIAEGINLSTSQSWSWIARFAMYGPSRFFDQTVVEAQPKGLRLE
jgi:hypothetical protein